MSKTRLGKHRKKAIRHTKTRRKDGGYDEVYGVEKSKPGTTKIFKRETTVSKNNDIKSTYSSKKVKHKKKGTKIVEKKGVYDSTKKFGKRGGMSSLTKGRKVTKTYK